MALFDLFSKRQQRARGEVPDVYAYDKLPTPFRVQVAQIVGDMLGDIQHGRYGHSSERPWEAYKLIVNSLAREYGVFRLHGNEYEDRHYPTELVNFFLSTKEIERALDVIELSVRYADRMTRDYMYLGNNNFNDRVDNGIAELNARFKENGVGYQYENGELVRLDSDLLHSEAVKPALTLLRTKEYAGPREEFLKAHEHYRHGRHEEALTDALKSFESTMKAICDRKGWSYDKNATAKVLVATCLSNNLVDAFWQNHLTGLRATLESSIATARNKLGGHGQGSTLRQVPRELVSYVLHMTASTIVFLIESAARP